MNTIHPLPADVRACIRTGVALTSFAQAVEELVLNSIDAGASSIAVRVDLTCFKIQVVDNGMGISFDQFHLIGERYSTSKCHSVEDLENLKYFGYRGEAIASLRTASSFLEIVSRPRSSVITYSKCFQNGVALGVTQASVPRPSVGATVTAHDLFYNLPVRRKRLNAVLEIEKIRYRISGIALIWPNVSFSFRDDSVGHVILQTYKCSGIATSFSYIFTPARARGLLEVVAEQDEFRLSGLVSKDSYSRMDLQFVFINKRLVLKSSIHRQINKIMSRSLILRRKGLANELLERNTNTGAVNTGSPQKQLERYAIFVINVECPFSAYDITFDPSKTLVEFHNWPKLIHLLQDMLYGFLRKENLISSSEPASSTSPYDVASDDGDDDDDEIADDENDIYQNNNFENGLKNEYEDAKQNLSLATVQKSGKVLSKCFENGLFSKTVCRPKIQVQEKAVVSEKQTKSTANLSGQPKASIFTQLQSSAGLEEAAAVSVSQQNNYKNKSYILHPHDAGYCLQKPVHTCSHPESLLSLQNVNYTEVKQTCDQYAPGTSKSYNDNSLLCQHSCENDILMTKSRLLGNKYNLSEDTEEVIIKKPALSKRNEITLGSSVQYSSTLRGLRAVNKVSSSNRASEIITNTLQQLRHATQKSVKHVGDLYKTPTKVAVSNNVGLSSSNYSKLQNEGLAASKELSIETDISYACAGIQNNTQQMNKSHSCEQSEMFGDQVTAGNMPGLNHGLSISHKSRSPVTFRCTTEDKSLGGNDGGNGQKRSLTDSKTHASKLAKLMRDNTNSHEEMCNKESGEADSSKYTNILNVFNYKKQQRNMKLDSKKSQHSSSYIPKGLTKECELSNDVSGDSLSWSPNIATKYLGSLRSEDKIGDCGEDRLNSRDKIRLNFSDKEILNSNDKESGLNKLHSSASSSSNTKWLCSKAACGRCCCCHHTHPTKVQLNNVGDDLPFSMYKKNDTMQMAEDEENSVEISVVLCLPFNDSESNNSRLDNLRVIDSSKANLMSTQNICTPTVNSDSGPVVNSESAVITPVHNHSITSKYSDRILTESQECSSRQRLSGKEYGEDCLSGDHLNRICLQESGTEGCESSTSTPEMSQGFIVTTAHLDQETNVNVISESQAQSKSTTSEMSQGFTVTTTQLDQESHVIVIAESGAQSKSSTPQISQGFSVITAHLGHENHLNTICLPEVETKSFGNDTSALEISPCLTVTSTQLDHESHLNVNVQSKSKTESCGSNTSTPEMSQGFTVTTKQVDKENNLNLTCLSETEIKSVDSNASTPKMSPSLAGVTLTKIQLDQGNHLNVIAQSKSEIKSCGSNTSTPEISQGFTVTSRQLEKNDSENVSDVSSASKQHCTDSVNNTTDSSNYFHSPGVSPINKATSLSPDTYPEIESNLHISVHCLQSKVSEDPMASVKCFTLSDSDTEIYVRNAMNTDPVEVVANLSSEVLSSQEANFTVQSQKTTEVLSLHSSSDSGLISSDLPNIENTIIDSVVENIPEKHCGLSANNYEASQENEESQLSHKPVGEVYQRIQDADISTDLDIENREKFELPNDDVSDADLGLINDTLVRVSKKNVLLNASCEDKTDISKIRNMISDAKQMFQTMQEVLGISNSTEKSLTLYCNDEEPYAATCHHKKMFYHNGKSDDCLVSMTENTACDHLNELGVHSPRTSSKYVINDSALNMSPEDIEKQIMVGFRSSLHSACLTNGKRGGDGNISNLNISNVSNLNIALSADSMKPGLSHLGFEHKDCGDNSISLQEGTALSTYESAQVKYTQVKHSRLLNSEDDLRDSVATHLLDKNCTDSETDQANLMSSGDDELLMMIHEPVLHTQKLAEIYESCSTGNNLIINESELLEKPDCSAIKEVPFDKESSQIKENTVNIEAMYINENMTRDLGKAQADSSLGHFNGVVNGPDSVGNTQPVLMSSSLSLIRLRELTEESNESCHPDKQMNEAHVHFANIRRMYKDELPIALRNPLSVTQDNSDVEITVDQNVKMDGAAVSKDETILKCDSTQMKNDECQEEIAQTSCWKEIVDSETGTRMFVSNTSGHTVTEEQWKLLSSQTQREMLGIISEISAVTEKSATGTAVNALAAFDASKKRAFKDMVSSHFEEEEKEALSKWRKGERPVQDKNVEADMSALMSKWINPAFLNYKQVGLVADVCPSDAVSRSCFNSLSSVEFTKGMLGNVKVLGQLDNKFIVSVIDKSENLCKAISPKCGSLLVLFDQHAVHERIRLEHLTKECYESEGGERTIHLKRSEINPAQMITMDQDDLRIMKAFSQEFNRIGVHFSVDKTSRNTVHISSLPLCLLEKDAGELKRNRITNIIETVENLIKEHIELLKSTNGACGRLPLTIHKVLCSQACHGAVKFGDKLTLQECQDLVSSLASCNLPFQCAHGRPSVAPLINLDVLERELYSVRRPINLRKISQHINH